MITQGFTEDTIITRGFAGGVLVKIVRKFRRAVYMMANKVNSLLASTSSRINERR